MSKYPKQFQKAYDLFKLPQVRVGLGLFVMTLLVLCGQFFTATAGAFLATAPLVIKLDKTGASGDNLKLLEDLEKRMSNIQLPAFLTKDEIDLQVRAAMDKFKDVNPDVIRELLGDSDKSLRAMIIKQGEVITRLEAEGKHQPEDMSTRAQVAKWMKEHKDIIDQVRAGKSGVSLPPIQLQRRAPITMLNSTSLGGSAFLPNAQVQPGVIDLVRTQPTFWQALTKGATKANPLVWVNKKNKQGNAAFIGEGVLKPLASFELNTENSVPKKAAERMKVSTEMLYDVEGLTSMIETELAFEVEVAANTAVLTGVESSTNPKGVTQYATLFTLTTVETTTPNNMDAIYAAVVQLQTLNFFTDIRAYVNPIDLGNMNLAKGTDGHYIIPPFTTANGTTIAGVPVVPDNNIAVGYLLIGDFSKYKVMIYQDFFISWGWENDDFSKNLITVIGEIRFHQFVSSNHVGAFIYDTFANIKTAITA